MENKTKVVLKIAVPVVFALALIGVGSFYLGANTITTSNFAGSLLSSPLHVAFVTSSGACSYPIGSDAQAECLQGVVAESHNVYTASGMNATANMLFCGGAATCPALAPFAFISVGQINVSQTATDTCLGNSSQAGAGLVKGCGDWLSNGLTQAEGTVAFVSSPALANGNTSITKTFTCTSCVNTLINATALYNSTTTCETNAVGCNAFAEANFTAATLQTNDQINVTWYIWTQ